MNLTGKTALVTGASGGIGAVIARIFAKAGAHVILGYGNNADPANQLAEEIAQSGGQALCLGFDVGDEAAVKAAFANLSNQKALPDILINNAGSFPIVPLLEMSAQEWDAVQASNLRSAFLCSQAALQYWTRTKTAGNIVNIASIAAHLSHQHLTHYCAAKAGMVALSRNLAQEFGSQGIRVNTVSPGLVWRQSLETDWPDGVARWKKAAPLARVVDPKEVANACLFLASDQASGITGVELPVDAGISVALPF
jgi:NAD(P)-dependent dehydrogenase (short-subunit alcohol dehydrogenase family)